MWIIKAVLEITALTPQGYIIYLIYNVIKYSLRKNFFYELFCVKILLYFLNLMNYEGNIVKLIKRYLRPNKYKPINEIPSLYRCCCNVGDDQ